MYTATTRPEPQNGPAGTEASSPKNAKSSERGLFERLNKERRSRGLSELAWHDKLQQSSQEHAELMAKRGELSHQFPGEPKMGQRISTTGLRFTDAAENVAFGSDVDAVHGGLMASPPHRGNILQSKFTHVGIAVVERGERLYAVQNFATVLPEYSAEDMETAIVRSFNRERKERRIPPLRPIDEPYLRRAACPGGPGVNGAMAHVGAQAAAYFTSSDPDHLPDSMLKRVADPNLRRFAVGACFAPDEEHGSGNFWVMVAFFSSDQSR